MSVRRDSWRYRTSICKWIVRFISIWIVFKQRFIGTKIYRGYWYRTKIMTSLALQYRYFWNYFIAKCTVIVVMNRCQHQHFQFPATSCLEKCIYLYNYSDRSHILFRRISMDVIWASASPCLSWQKVRGLHNRGVYNSTNLRESWFVWRWEESVDNMSTNYHWRLWLVKTFETAIWRIIYWNT